MSDKKSVKKNYIYNVIYQVFLLIVPLVVTPYVSRVLLPEGIGQYSYSYSLITYFTIFGSLGFGYYAQREIAKHQGDKYNQSKVFWEINICRLLPVSLALIVNLLFCLTNIYGDYNLLMYIFSFNIIAVAFDIAFLFQGNEEFGKIVIRNVIIKTISIAAIFVFVKDSGDVWVYALINALILVLSNISLWSYLPKMLTKVSRKELKPLSHLKGTIRLFIPTIATSIYTVLDKTLIGALINDTYTVIEDGIEVIKKYSDLENGYYEQSEKLVKMGLTIISCIGTVMIPRNSNEIANGNFEKVKDNIYKSSRFVWLLGVPLMFGLMATANNFVGWYYGDGYDKCITLIMALSPIILIIGFSNVFGVQYLVPIGKDTKFAIALLSGAGINLVMNLILIPFLWSLGAAIGTLIAETMVTIIMAILIRKDISFLKILSFSWKYLLSGAVMFTCVYITSMYLNSSIINSLILVIEGALIYGIMLLILVDKFSINLLTGIFKSKRVI